MCARWRRRRSGVASVPRLSRYLAALGYAALSARLRTRSNDLRIMMLRVQMDDFHGTVPESLRRRQRVGAVGGEVETGGRVAGDLNLLSVDAGVDPVLRHAEALRDLRHGAMAWRPPRVELLPRDQETMLASDVPHGARGGTVTLSFD